jgi:hypothetical protein
MARASARRIWPARSSAEAEAWNENSVCDETLADFAIAF